MPRSTARREALVLTQTVVGPSCVLPPYVTEGHVGQARHATPYSSGGIRLKARPTAANRRMTLPPLRDKLFRLYRLRLNAHGPQSRERERHGQPPY
jgi:hypothetical protein